MSKEELRALMPALANKTYFNNPALPTQMLQNSCAAMGRGEGQ
jgi:hypothetical protein